MDNQCDRCGKQLPQIRELEKTDPNRYPGVYEEEEKDIHIGFHVVIGSDNWILGDGETDWDPDREFDLCPTCRDKFLQIWEQFYGKS